MALTVELGTFIAFLAIPFATFIFLPRLTSWGFTGFLLFIALGLIGFVMLGGAALLMSARYDVVQSTVVPPVSATSVTEQRDVNGTLVFNTTKTAQVEGYTEQIPIINAYHDIWSYILAGLTILYGLLYFKIMVTGSV